MNSPALIPGSSTHGSAAAQSLRSIMMNSAGGEEKWWLEEISLFNFPVRRRCFPKEASRALREVLDETLSMAMSLHISSPLAFNAFSLFVFFPRLLLRPLPDGCKGSFAAVERTVCDCCAM